MVSVTARTAHVVHPPSSRSAVGDGLGLVDRATEETWLAACEELGLDLVRQRGGSFLRSTATGLIDGHEVSIRLVGGTRHERFVRTMYSVRFDAAHAPPFTVSNRVGDDDPTVTTGNPYFDRRVAITTEAAGGLKAFLTAPRRTRILHMMSLWPSVTISNHFARVWTEGVEDDFDTLVSSAHDLVEAATALDRTWQEVRLGEAGVLRDLFTSGREIAETATRFDAVYKNRAVSWCGEVLQIGAVERVGQRVAVLLGSVDGRSGSSGRVVALTVLDPALRVTQGDIVSVTGNLVHLEPKKRMFRIE